MKDISEEAVSNLNKHFTKMSDSFNELANATERAFIGLSNSILKGFELKRLLAYSQILTANDRYKKSKWYSKWYFKLKIKYYLYQYGKQCYNIYNLKERINGKRY